MSCKKIRPYYLGRTEDLPKVEFPINGYLYLCEGRKNKCGIVDALITVCQQEELDKPQKGHVFAKGVTIHKDDYTGNWDIIFKYGYLPKPFTDYLKSKARDILKNC